MALDPIDPSSSSPPPRTRLLTNLSTQSQLLDQFFTSLSSSSTNQQSPLPHIYTLLKETTDDLLKLRKDVQAHQEVWTRIERKKKKVVDLERRSRALMRTLEGERRELDLMVKEGREIIESVDKVEKSMFSYKTAKPELMIDPIHVPNLLAHAHALARHSSAPVSSLLTPIDKAQYQPWPTENAMRQGLLFQMEGSMSGIGQTGQVGDGQSGFCCLLTKLTSRRGQRRRCNNGSGSSCTGTSGRAWEAIRSGCCVYTGPQFGLGRRVGWISRRGDVD